MALTASEGAALWTRMRSVLVPRYQARQSPKTRAPGGVRVVGNGAEEGVDALVAGDAEDGWESVFCCARTVGGDNVAVAITAMTAMDRGVVVLAWVVLLVFRRKMPRFFILIV